MVVVRVLMRKDSIRAGPKLKPQTLKSKHPVSSGDFRSRLCSRKGPLKKDTSPINFVLNPEAPNNKPWTPK